MSSTSGYAELKRRVTEAGLLRKRPAKALLSIWINAFFWIFCLFIIFYFRSWPASIIGALILGFCFSQLGYMGHESGHKQMFERGWQNQLVHLIAGPLVMGMSAGWWIDKHNAHHANPNVEDMDPDIDTPIVAYSIDQAKLKKGISAYIVRHQAWLFFPILTLLAWTMHVSSFEFLILKPKVKHRLLEMSFMVLHFLIFWGALIVFLGIWQALVVIVGYHIIWGLILGSAFAPNHKGMRVLGRHEQMEFLQKQVVTARNIRPNWLVDFLYGRLNLQIEHHLFPSMPRCNLREARTIVRNYCQEIGLDYHEVGILESYRELLGYLQYISRFASDERPSFLAA